LSKELYEGGKADATKIKEYVEVARQKGILEAERLDLTGGTMMAIYTAVSAEAGKPDSKVREFAFNNPAREGRLVLWSEKVAKDVPEKVEKSLMREVPPATVDPNAPSEVLDVRLLYAEDPEAIQQMADPKRAEEYISQVVAQIRELKTRGISTVRLTGIPMWLIQGSAFAAAREGIQRIIFHTLTNDSILYDAQNPDLVGSGVELIKKPVEIKVDLSGKEIKEYDAVFTGRKTQETLGAEISRNNVVFENFDLSKIPPHIALRMFDSIHSFSSSLRLEGIEIFQHNDPRSHDLIPKTTDRNSDLLPKEKRTWLELSVHDAVERAGGDYEKAVMELAKEAVNKASTLSFTEITNVRELAVAGKVAHAAHGLIEELRYFRREDSEAKHVVKSWKSEKKS